MRGFIVLIFLLVTKKRLCSDVLLSDTASFREFVGRCELQRDFLCQRNGAGGAHIGTSAAFHANFGVD